MSCSPVPAPARGRPRDPRAGLAVGQPGRQRGGHRAAHQGLEGRGEQGREGALGERRGEHVPLRRGTVLRRGGVGVARALDRSAYPVRREDYQPLYGLTDAAESGRADGA